MIEAGHLYRTSNDILRGNSMFPLGFMKNNKQELLRLVDYGEIFLVLKVRNPTSTVNWHLVKILDQYSNVGSIWHWSDPPLQLNPGIKLVC